jgi:hypothetical protein
MIFVTANPMALDVVEPHPIRRVRTGGVPEFPVHHTLNLREQSLKAYRPEFVDWLNLNEFEMVEFFNDHPSFRQKVVEMFEAGEMSDSEVIEWIEKSLHDTQTPSDVSYGFRSEADYMAFKLRWL